MSNIRSSKAVTVSSRSYSFLRFDNTQASAISLLDADASVYLARVAAAGGSVGDSAQVHAAFRQAKAQGWYSSAVFWFGGFGGYKTVGSGVDTWYNMAGAQDSSTTDARQTTDSRRPIFTAAISTLGGRPGLKFDDAGSDNGRYLSLASAASKFPTAASLFVSFAATTDSLYSVFGTTANDQWWNVGAAGNYLGVFRNSRLNNAGTTAPATGSQYWSVISSSSSYDVYTNGTLNVSTSADYNAGTDCRISDTTGRDDRALRGHITELVVLNVAANSTIRTAVEARMSSRYFS